MMKMTNENREWLNTALGQRDRSWAFFHCLRHEDLAAMDAELVRIRHPLAYEAGNQMHRFYSLHESGFRFEIETHDENGNTTGAPLMGRYR